MHKKATRMMPKPTPKIVLQKVARMERHTRATDIEAMFHSSGTVYSVYTSGTIWYTIIGIFIVKTLEWNQILICAFPFLAQNSGTLTIEYICVDGAGHTAVCLLC